jgi:fatty acid desaturase
MRLFAHSPKDAVLVVLALVQIPLLVGGTLSVTAWSPGPVIALVAAVVFLMCTNFQCVSHNAIHNPFFSSDLLNRVFSVVNTLCIGVPQSLYRVHHLHHHKYNNDAIDPVTGTTRDVTSTFRYGRGGAEEAVVTYATLGFFRTSFGYMWGQARTKGLVGLVLVESAALLLFVAVLAAVNWRGVVFFYVPVWYLGQMAALAENYLEHHGAIPGDRRTDSVSAYGRVYNFIWFNNGYHQEHHWKPQVHWTKVAALRAGLPPETRRRVVRSAHWFNFLPPPRSAYQDVQAVRGPAPDRTPAAANG